MLHRLRAVPSAFAAASSSAASSARVWPAAVAASARSFSGRPAKPAKPAAAEPEPAAAAAADDSAASASASASSSASGSSSSSIRRAFIAPATPLRSVLRSARPHRVENTASFQARVAAGAAMLSKGNKATGAEVANAAATAAAAEAAAAAAAKAATVAASPLAAAAAEDLSSGGTALELIPGESSYAGRSALPVTPLLSSIFRTKSSAQYSPSKRRAIACSPQKLNDLCRMVRGVSVAEALIQLKLSQKRKAPLVAATIARAAQHGMNTHNMERSRLYVSELWVGQGQHLKRLDIKGRGRAGTKRRYRSHLFVRVAEQGADAERYKGVWKHGGRSHDRAGREIRIGRAGRTISTIQATLATMSQWRTARGMAARPQWKTRSTDAAKAFRAQGTATDLEAVYGKQTFPTGTKIVDRVEKPFE